MMEYGRHERNNRGCGMDERAMHRGFFGRMRGGRRGMDERGEMGVCEAQMMCMMHMMHKMHAHGGHGDDAECRMPDFHGHHDHLGHHDHHGFEGLRGAFMKHFGGRMGGRPHGMRGVFPLGVFCEDAFDVVVKDTEEGYLAVVMLPGIEKSSISLEALPGLLLVRVERIGENGEAAELPLLLMQCDEAAIRASYRDGALEISIPRTKGRKIEVD